MNQAHVRQILRREPDSPKLISMKDGRTIRVDGVERWLAGPDYMDVLDRNGEIVYVPYHAIASIRVMRVYRRRRRAAEA